MLLQGGRLLSNFGTQSTGIAYPLLVLAITKSAGDAVLVAFVRSVTQILWALPAGLAVVRWPRRRVMVIADLARLIAVATLGAVVVTHDLNYSVIPVVAFVEGIDAAGFGSPQAAALRAVVPLVRSRQPSPCS